MVPELPPPAGAAEEAAGEATEEAEAIEEAIEEAIAEAIEEATAEREELEEEGAPPAPPSAASSPSTPPGSQSAMAHVLAPLASCQSSQESTGQVPELRSAPPPSPSGKEWRVHAQTNTRRPRRVSGLRSILRRRREDILMANGELKPNFVEGVAQRVIEACRREDADARITYVGRDEHERTRVRVRAGGNASIESLQRALSRLMPYAKVRTSVDTLDGSATAEILVPTAADEYAMAHGAASQTPLHRATAACAAMMMMIGVGMWIATAAEPGLRDI